MNLKKILTFALAAAAFLFRGGASAPAEEAESSRPWSFEFELYGLMASIYGSSALGIQPGSLPAVDASGDIDIPFSKILDTLNMGGMAHLEVHHESGWGLWLDYGFMDLGDSSSLGYLNKTFRDVGLYQGALESYVLYREELKTGYIDYYAGIRAFFNRFKLQMKSDSPLLGGAWKKKWYRTENWIDPIIGARWTCPLGKRWKLRLRGEAGGFGIGSDFTCAGGAGFLYIINDFMELDLRYKALWVDYERGHSGKGYHFLYRTVTHGPIVGLNFKF